MSMSNQIESLPNHIVLFDGVCNLCSASVQFIIAHDSQTRFYFAPLQSTLAQKLLKKYPMGTAPLSSVILISNGKIYTESDAALQIARRLDGILPLFYIGIILPKFLRDALYKLIARNRYRLFGRENECWLPTPNLKHRFLA